jgi:hypothetical protein
MKTSLYIVIFSLLVVSAQLRAFAQEEKSLAKYLDDAKRGEANAQNEVGVNRANLKLSVVGIWRWRGYGRIPISRTVSATAPGSDKVIGQ